MLTWVWIGIIAIVVVGAVLVVRQQSGTLSGNNPRRLRSLERTVFDLQIGDIVQYEGTDWVVEGQLTYDDSGFVWLEYLLQDGDRQRWLSVEEDDRLEVLWLEAVTHLDISGHPPAQMTINNITYHQVESGSARMTRQGTTLNRQAQACRYFDYTGPEATVLCVENWNGDMDITIGKQIRPSALTLLPGDGHRVYDP
jgi:hypothetical protein